MSIDRDRVVETLRSVRFPGLSRDIVSFGFVKDVVVTGQDVSVRLEMTTENAQAGDQIRSDAERALKSLAGVGSVQVKIDVQLPQFQPGATPQPPRALPDVRLKIAVASGKGGVGKSTVTTNLALAMTKLGKTVGLMDSDIYGPSQQMMMGIDEQPYVNENQRILPVERYGVKVMSIGMIVDTDQPVVWRGPMVMRAVQQFLQDVEWGALDVLLVDLPPGTGDAQLTLTQTIELSGAVIVTTPQDVALIDARKGLGMFQKVGVPVSGLIENMSHYVCSSCGHREEIFKSGGGKKTAGELGVPFLGSIPLDPRIVAGGDSGEPIVATDPDGAIAGAFLDAARKILASVGD